MAYISASPFVLEQIHRLSAQSFSLVFAANGCGILIARQIGASNVGRIGPSAVMRGGLICQLAGATGVLCFILFDPSLAPLLVCLFVAVGSVGAIMPMATALAMQDHPERAGSASGLLGFTQFTLVGIAGAASAIPMAVAMPACSLAAFIALRSAATARRTAS